MRFEETKIKDCYVIDIDKKADFRGYFARSYCEEEFAKQGIKDRFVQCNINYNNKRGVTKGMHYQKKPFEESKLVQCFTGSIYDVVLDLRKSSPTYKKWVGIELSAENRRMLYVPRGCAHGFQTLEDNSTVFYQVGEVYSPESEAGIYYDDENFSINWPIKNNIIMSEKDRNWPIYEG